MAIHYYPSLPNKAKYKKWHVREQIGISSKKGSPMFTRKPVVGIGGLVFVYPLLPRSMYSVYVCANAGGLTYRTLQQ